MVKKLPDNATIIDSIKPEHFIGRGSSASVYAIPGNRDMVVRVTRGMSLENLGEAVPTPCDDPFEGRNFGQAIADYGSGVTVLMRQHGREPGVPSALIHAAAGEKPSLETARELYEGSMHDLADMPVSAYVGLLEDMVYLESMGRRIDPKPSNFLIDAQGERINVVDVCTSKFPDDAKNKNSPAQLAQSLMHHFGRSFCEYDVPPPELGECRVQIFEKMLDAAEKVGRPFVHEQGSINCFNSALNSLPITDDQREAFTGRVNWVNAKAAVRSENACLPNVTVSVPEQVKPPVISRPAGAKSADAGIGGDWM